MFIERPEILVFFLFHGKEGLYMDPKIKLFRESHDCKFCVYFLKQCKAKKRCVFDYLPIDSKDEEIEVFFIE